MALPTPNSEITATVDPQPIADAIAKAIDAVVQPLIKVMDNVCLLYTSPSPRDQRGSRMPSSA